MNEGVEISIQLQKDMMKQSGTTHRYNTFKEWLDRKLNEDSSGLSEIIRSIPNYYSGKVRDDLMTNYIYHYLTQHDDRSKLVSDTLQKDPAKYQQYNNVYKQILQGITQSVSKLNWKPEDNGAWIEWYRNGVMKGNKSDGMTSKRYISVKPEDSWDILQKLPILARNLQNVQTDPNAAVIGFKIPMNFGSFYGQKDNIVIHFYDKNAGNQIEQAVQGFLREIGKQEMDRSQMGRTTMGRDGQGTSDSMLVARKVIDNLKHNKQAIMNMMNNPQKLSQTIQYIIQKVSIEASHRNPQQGTI